MRVTAIAAVQSVDVTNLTSVTSQQVFLQPSDGSRRNSGQGMNTTSPHSAPRVVRFARFELDLGSDELRRDGLRVAIPRQSLQVLTLLLERPGELVTRDTLRQGLWPDGTHVDFEHGLNAVVKRLRDALGDSADAPRFVETLSRRGYRFIGPVEMPDDRERSATGAAPWPARSFVFLAAGLAAAYLIGAFRSRSAERN